VQKFIEHRKGFTLIEMLIVIIIIGALAAMLMLSVGAAKDRAEAAKFINDLKVFQKAAILCRTDRGNWKYENGWVSDEARAKGIIEHYTDRTLAADQANAYTFWGGNTNYGMWLTVHMDIIKNGSNLKRIMAKYSNGQMGVKLFKSRVSTNDYYKGKYAIYDGGSDLYFMVVPEAF
jgi:prepilin-type N-terminal cleavage/methylation domain-containing protein